MKKRILFITQNLARTGSEMVLWYLLRNLDPDKYEVAVFCLKKGELLELLPEHIEKHVLYRVSPQFRERMLRRVLKFIKKDPLTYQLNDIQQRFKADIWYVNTIVIPEVYAPARAHGVKIVTHVHELLYAFTFVKGSDFQKVTTWSDVLIGCSPMVCDHLSELNHPNIRLQPSFIDTDTIRITASRVLELKSQHQIQKGDFVWVISGGVTYMKGLDHLLEILEAFKNENIKIIWLGPSADTGLEYYVKEIADRKYPGKLIFTGGLSADYYNYLSIANGLLILSREESFSLVMVEAAYLGIPIVSFNIGIAKEFIVPGTGRVVDSWNLPDLVQAMKWLQENPGQDQALLKEMAMRYDVKNQLPAYEQLLNELCIINPGT